MNEWIIEWMNEWIADTMLLHTWCVRSSCRWCSSVRSSGSQTIKGFRAELLKNRCGPERVCQWKSFCAQYDLSVSLMCRLQFFPIYFNNEIIQSPQCLLKMKRWYASACEPSSPRWQISNYSFQRSVEWMKIGPVSEEGKVMSSCLE